MEKEEFQSKIKRKINNRIDSNIEHIELMTGTIVESLIDIRTYMNEVIFLQMLGEDTNLKESESEIKCE